MVKKNMYQRIQHFRKRGLTKADIVRETGLHKRTVRKYYHMSEKQYLRYIDDIRNRTKIFEPFKPHVLDVYKENGFQRLEKSSVYDYLEEKCGKVPGTERSFRNYVNYLIDTGQLKFNENTRKYYPVEELPYGQQMQIDFGEYRTRSGLKLYIFAAVLSASRYKYSAFQTEPFTTLDLINHLLDCFEYLGGMPRELVIDQDSVMVLKENNGDIIYTKDFRHFREEMGLKMYVCRKSDPESKGKIENVIKFVKRNFLRIRDFDDIEEARNRLLKWLSRRANGKISLATRRIPREMFIEERKYLTPLRNSIYRNSANIGREKRKTDSLGNISVNSCKYPVPEEYRSHEVEIYKTNETLFIYDIRTGEKIQEYDICPIPGTKVVNQSRYYHKEQNLQELKSKLKELFQMESWNIFIDNNCRAFPRYFRDQYTEAVKKFSKGINQDYLQAAIELCLENRTYSMANLWDTYQYYKQEAEFNQPECKLKNIPELRDISRKNQDFHVEKHQISVYHSLVTEVQP
ncbi:IS21 family transposase [Patescibacteria group bacterium]|nr:IS21 family transposase [Patescibacteria group bacterium]